MSLTKGVRTDMKSEGSNRQTKQGDREKAYILLFKDKQANSPKPLPQTFKRDGMQNKLYRVLLKYRNFL